MIVKRSPTDGAAPPEEDNGNTEGMVTLNTGVDEGLDLVIEGSPEDVGGDEPEDVRGKTREQLAADLLANKAALEAERARGQFTPDSLANALKGAFPQQAPQTPAPSVEGYRIPRNQVQGRMQGETEEAYQRRLEQEFIGSPIKGVDSRIQAALEPVLATLGENQLKLGRRLALSDPEGKDVYARFGTEVEQYVANLPPAQKIMDSEVYQKAISAVKAAHSDVFVNEEVSKKVAEALKVELEKLGFTPETLAEAQKKAAAAKKPAVQTPASPDGQRPAGAARTIVKVPAWYAREQAAKGLEPAQIALAWKSRNGQ